jgi:cell division protein FtsA
MVQKNTTTNLPPNLVAGLDIGTTKVCMVAALVNGRELEIIGTGIAPSTGLKKGIIVNREATVQAIQKALEECQKKCGYTIEKVCVGIAGEHVEGVNSHGVVSVKNDVIDQNDIIRVIDSAKPACPESKIPIHILSKDYTVDYQSGFDNPQGISGKRLEANVHVILASSTALANITRSCADAGLKVERVVLEPYASSLSVLNEDEKELGVLLLDIGGGTTDLIAYKNKSIQVSEIIPIGGNNVTNDISVGLITPRGYAENIKCKEGSVSTDETMQEEIIQINSIEGHPPRPVFRKALTEIIEPRYKEIFETALSRLRANNASFQSLCSSGVVLTGGGSQVKNLSKLAEKVFGLHTRIGYPNAQVQGANDFVQHPAYATAVGLLKYTTQNDSEDYAVDSKTPSRTKKKKEDSIFKFIKQFF